MDNFDPNNVFLAIATKRLKTGFVVQGHILEWFLEWVMTAENSALISQE